MSCFQTSLGVLAPVAATSAVATGGLSIPTALGLSAGASLLGAGADVAWNMYAQNKTWKREDSAISRRVADLKRNGMSPILASGQGASTSAPIKALESLSDLGKKSLEQVVLAKDMEAKNASIATTKAQKRYIDLQASGQKIKNAETLYNLNLSANNGRRTTDSIGEIEKIAQWLWPALSEGMKYFTPATVVEKVHNPNTGDDEYRKRKGTVKQKEMQDRLNKEYNKNKLMDHFIYGTGTKTFGRRN